MKELSVLADDDQLTFLVEALTTSVEEAEVTLQRHQSEDPPLVDTQMIGEAAQDYLNLIDVQKRRKHALEYFLEEVKKCLKTK